MAHFCVASITEVCMYCEQLDVMHAQVLFMYGVGILVRCLVMLKADNYNIYMHTYIYVHIMCVCAYMCIPMSAILCTISCPTVAYLFGYNCVQLLSVSYCIVHFCRCVTLVKLISSMAQGLKNFWPNIIKWVVCIYIC